MIGLFDGVEIITSPYLTKTIEVRRSWKERLFTWPWHPLRAMKFVEVASDQVLMYGNKAVMHPATLSQLKKELETGKTGS